MPVAARSSPGVQTRATRAVGADEPSNARRVAAATVGLAVVVLLGLRLVRPGASFRADDLHVEARAEDQPVARGLDGAVQPLLDDLARRQIQVLGRFCARGIPRGGRGA